MRIVSLSGFSISRSVCLSSSGSLGSSLSLPSPSKSTIRRVLSFSSRNALRETAGNSACTNSAACAPMRRIVFPTWRNSTKKTGPVFKMHNDPRITRVGRLTRRLSLDELPQFANVLKGDLSVVGPRPALPSEVATYTPRQRQRLLVKSGITCYWQTRRNRDSITFDEWVDLDLLYIKKCGALTDLKLIVQTVGCVLTAQGN